MKRTRGWSWLLCAAWAVAILFAHVRGFPPLVRQELGSVDWRFRKCQPPPPRADIIILAIDQPSCSLPDRFDPLPAELQALRNFPYPRAVYAAAIERLGEAGAKIVAIDLLFFSPKVGDETLQTAVAKHRERVVLGSNFSDDETQLLEPAVAVPEEVTLAEVCGYVNFWPDVDGVVRRARAQLVRVPGQPAELSFTARIARKFGSETLPREPTYIGYSGPAGTVKTVPFYKLFYDRSWEGELEGGAAFRNKIVFIGPTGNFHHDQHPTPFGVVDGVEIHANALATWLRGNAPRDAARWVGWLVVLALAVGTAGILSTEIHPLFKLGALGGIGMAYAWGTLAVFKGQQMLLPVAAPVWTVTGGGVLGIALQVVAEQLEKLRVRRTLERYVSKPVADEILRHGEEYQDSLRGERKSVAILFSDIRGFTTISEQSDPVPLVEQLNEYFTVMVDVVMKHDGTLSKFIGDAIMALYGAPLSKGAVDDAWRAVATAHEMRVRLAELHRQWAARGLPQLKIGVGLNFGEVVVGDIGSPQRREYTVIGDPVNVASRVEGLNKDFGTDILLTESVYELVKDRVEAELRGETAVKGRGKPVKVYALTKLK